MLHRKTNQKGLVKMIVIILVVLVLLAYFGLNLKSIVGSQTFQDNWNFLKDLIIGLWEHVLKVPVMFVWNTILLPLLSKITAGNQ